MCVGLFPRLELNSDFCKTTAERLPSRQALLVLEGGSPQLFLRRETLSFLWAWLALSLAKSRTVAFVLTA